MSRYELSNEGCAPAAGERAFQKYNEILRKQPDQLTQAIAFLALNQELPVSHINAANAIIDVLDTTNNGTQIGIGPDTETGWAHVFDDKDHREAQTVHNKYQQALHEILTQLEHARGRLAALSESVESQEYEIVRELVSSLEDASERAQAELIAKRRLRGMQTLRVIALLGGASEAQTDLPLVA
ncbi:MAG TPA: hypothetical protein VLG36_05235 [Candidatus Chromulinivoraceae bacterium]|nr:hypothetical protein [Candidatus Chromulinivoraceae bacterium]